MAFHLQADSLHWALAHVEKYGDTDILPRAFEFEAIRHCWQVGSGFGEIRARGLQELLRAMDLQGWALRPQRRCVAPKNRFGFRIATQLDPVDTLLFTALVYEAGHEIEAARIPRNDGVVHSYRFSPAPNGDFFDRAFGYRSFLAATRAGAETSQWVVTADIADFYPRIYSHPLENALRVAVTNRGQVEALIRFFSQLNQGVSYGLPVGPSASRLLAELVISDIDRLLLSYDIRFVRFVDDYRIFCATEREAYNALAKLANGLFDSHGLTLQQHKTKILPSQDYLAGHPQDDEDAERSRLSDEFQRIVDEIGLDDPYGPIVYEDLPDELRERVDGLNLMGILEEQIALGEDANAMTIRFVLKRLGQLGEVGAFERLVLSPRLLYQVLQTVADFVSAVTTANNGQRLGGSLLALLDEAVIGHLDLNRAWLLNPFGRRSELDCIADLVRMLNGGTSHLERRELLLAAGTHASAEWLAAHRRNIDQEPPWCRRAFLAAARSLPGDQAAHWYKSVRPQLDLLEQAVSIWAEQI